MASSDNESDSDVDSSSSESSCTTYSSTRSFSEKEMRMRDMNFFYDKFGRCEKCQDIYWEMRHTWNDDDMGSVYSYSWYSDDRYQQYEDGKMSFIPYKEIMNQYRNKLLGCPDCPCNKDTPCSLRDQVYSCIKSDYRNYCSTDKEKDHCILCEMWFGSWWVQQTRGKPTITWLDGEKIWKQSLVSGNVHINDVSAVHLWHLAMRKLFHLMRGINKGIHQQYNIKRPWSMN